MKIDIKKFEKELYPGEYYYSTSFAIERFYSMVKKYGTQVVMEDKKFQKAKEVWITSAYGLGLSIFQKTDYWVRAEHIDTTPDSYLISFEEHPKLKGNTLGKVMNIEVTEWHHMSGEDLSASVKRKMDNKCYPEYFTLLVHGNQPGGKEVDLEQEFQKLKDIKANEIWFLSSSVGESDDNYLLVCLYPKRVQVEFSIKEEMKKNEDKTDILKPLNRKKGKKVVPLGEKRLPFPDLQKC